MLEKARDIEPNLAAHLAENRFERVWDDLRGQHRSARNRLRAFHVWFDGLRTLRLIHRLRDTDFPDCALGECAARVLGKDIADDPEAVLCALRRYALPPLMPIDGGV